MQIRTRALAFVLALAAFAAPSSADVVGKTVPPVALEGFTQTKAHSFDDFLGRAVLVEFFAYW
ncbi:MAG: hypothetical protein HZA53_14780 [Planctomycetes bacterium]|nr:hypothetical protein [Planctomycetota bacterium]